MSIENDSDLDFDDPNLNDNTIDNESDLLENSEEEDENLDKGIEEGSDSDSELDAIEKRENELLESFVATLARIDDNKFNYNEYVTLLETAHELGDLDKIRQSGELFASVFPLSPDLWLNWIGKEMIVSSSDTEMKRVQQLFKRALSDYFCANVALEYTKLAWKLSKIDDLWTEIISTYALDFMKGRSLFEAWRTFFMEKEPESPEKYSKLIKCYEKQLAIPLNQMEVTYIEFKVLCEREKDKYTDVDWKHIDELYYKAKEYSDRMQPFESQLTDLPIDSHQDRARIYKSYIKDTKSYLPEKFVQVLYERMVTECCLNDSCWLAYIEYLQQRDDFPLNDIERDHSNVFTQTDWDVCNRALRNCTWSAPLYIEKMRIGEKMELSKQEIRNVAEMALAAGFQKSEPLVEIWLEYIGYLRRNTNFESEQECDILRGTFQLAWDTLGRQFGVLADCNCEILQMWGRLEYGPLNDLVKGKELWTTVMESSDNAEKSALWIEFAHLELRKGIDGTRKVYRKALVARNIDNIQTVASAWIRFERCNGTLDQLKVCQEKCKSILSSISTNIPYKRKPFPVQYEKKSSQPKQSLKRKFPTDDRTSKDKRGKFETLHRVIVEPKSDDRKIKVGDRQTDKDSSEKSKDDRTIFMSNLNYNVTESDIESSFPELRIKSTELARTSIGKSRGFAYVELESEEDVPKALTFDRRMISGRPTFISKVSRDREQRSKFKYSTGNIEPNKLFIKNLPKDITVDELKPLFSSHGELKDIRLVCYKDGQPKGTAYVEYEAEQSAKQAVLKMDQYEVRGHKILVAISAPPPRNETDTSNTGGNLIGLGQGRRSKVDKGELKPRMSFIPRSVQKNVLGGTLNVSSDKLSSNGSASVIPTKSNDDFRKLLNKK